MLRQQSVELAAENKRLRAERDEAVYRLAELGDDLDFRWSQAQVTSPLVVHFSYHPQPRQSGWAWQWFESSCPCCKRPLDLTFFRATPESSSTPAAMASGTADAPPDAAAIHAAHRASCAAPQHKFAYIAVVLRVELQASPLGRLCLAVAC